MPGALMTVEQVKEARRLAWQGLDFRTIAQQMGVGYQPVRYAVRGKTWASITDPPALSWAEMWAVRRVARRLPCVNCGEESDRRVNGRCPACHTYFVTKGQEREVRYLYNRVVRLTEDEVADLYARYLALGSLQAVAADMPFSWMVLRRRFLADGYRMLPGRRVLNEGLVLQLRDRHYRGGESMSSLARGLGLGFSTVQAAIRGRTWGHVGGLPQGAGDGGKRPCSGCGLLTSRLSGLCVYCTQGR